MKAVNVESAIFVSRKDVLSDYESMAIELEKSIVDKDEHNAMKQFGIFIVLSQLLNGELGGERYNSMVRMINKTFRVKYDEYELN